MIVPQPQLSADERALLRELFRFYQANGPEAFASPASLAETAGLSVGQAGSAIASLFVKDLLTLKDAQVGRLSRDGLILATELFEP